MLACFFLHVEICSDSGFRSGIFGAIFLGIIAYTPMPIKYKLNIVVQNILENLLIPKIIFDRGEYPSG
jgi:hypothetical protein